MVVVFWLWDLLFVLILLVEVKLGLVRCIGFLYKIADGILTGGRWTGVTFAGFLLFFVFLLYDKRFVVFFVGRCCSFFYYYRFGRLLFRLFDGF